MEEKETCNKSGELSRRNMMKLTAATPLLVKGIAATPVSANSPTYIQPSDVLLECFDLLLPQDIFFLLNDKVSKLRHLSVRELEHMKKSTKDRLEAEAIDLAIRIHLKKWNSNLPPNDPARYRILKQATEIRNLYKKELDIQRDKAAKQVQSVREEMILIEAERTEEKEALIATTLESYSQTLRSTLSTDAAQIDSRVQDIEN